MSARGAKTGRRESRDKRPDVYRLWCEGRFEGEEAQRESRARGVRKRENNTPSDPAEGLEPFGMGIVLEMHRRNAVIRLDGSTEDLLCRFGAKLDLSTHGHLTVGDRVRVAKEPISGELHCVAIEPRRTLFSRPGPPDREHREQLLAANVDRLVVVCSVVQPNFNPGLVDRYVVAAQHSQIPITLVLNKMDLVDSIPSSVVDFVGLVDEIILTSAENGSGLDELATQLEGKTAVLTGQSGVGKSSILRKLIPGVQIRVGEVRAGDGKGRHTTTSSTLYTLPTGGQLIDTPGIRGLGFWNLSRQDLALVFPAFAEFAGTCKFSDCQHLNEPGCAIQHALDNEMLNERAYDSYLRILDSLN